LSESAKYVVAVEFANFEIAGAADGYRAGVAKSFPKALGTTYRISGTWAFDRFASDDGAIDVIEGHGHEIGDLGHTCVSSLAGARMLSHPAFESFSINLW
jgi:hypothetical protein